MNADNEYYLNNPLIHQDRRLAQQNAAQVKSEWVSRFACTDLRPLIICRGPIRKEAMDVFEEMGITHYGILLSEKDSIVYQNALAPELRILTDPDRVHRVPDYSGVDRLERDQRVEQIIQIAKDNHYNAVFAGYGFMAEDENMVHAVEAAGLNFIGPCSKTVHDAGLKDEAKRTALQVGVSVTPGIDNLTALTLLSKYPDSPSLQKMANQEELVLDQTIFENKNIEEQADAILSASYEKGIDFFSIEELGIQASKSVAKMFQQYPQNRLRLKAIGGGGGKGQRILLAPKDYEGDESTRIQKAASQAPGLILEILNEVKNTGVGDNKNILIELNIETTRHLEIQVVGNGDWCLAMGGRDCSLQMHEQKLLEVSVTTEELAVAIKQAEDAGAEAEAQTLKQELTTLQMMESEAERFSSAVGLDSLSTFECIVDRDQHFFMEMNTRIQVEHRVTELCYALQFTNPKSAEDYFIVDSLVEMMALLAVHGSRLPKPTRVARFNSALEARVNATNHALAPHAGGEIESWSNAIEGEIRDDQGIRLHKTSSGVFMKYTLAGAYDSNIALILTIGENRFNAINRLAEIIRCMKVVGKDLATNLAFHYGLLNWLMGNNAQARPTTKFIVPYLTAVSLLKKTAVNMDLNYTYHQIKSAQLDKCADEQMRKSFANVLDRKLALFLRPIARLLNAPHLLAGWLSIFHKHFKLTNEKIIWLSNPIQILSDSYHFLNMDYNENTAAAYMIWDHDQEILSNALNFYQSLEAKLGISDFCELTSVLESHKRPNGISEEQWTTIQASHSGFQAGTEILLILPYIGQTTSFFDLFVNDDLSIQIPDKLLAPELQEAMKKILAPPPTANSDEILAVSGGMFYPREAPGMEVFVKEGDHFDQGDPLYIVEVMKMFNKVNAPFSGTLEKVLVEEDGIIIKKGQPLFKVSPDEKIIVESKESIKQRKEKETSLFLDQII